MNKSLNFTAEIRSIVPIVLAAGIGVITGLLAVIFIHAIRSIETFSFGGLSDALRTVNPWAVVLIPALGGLLIGPLVTFLAPEAKGHGVPQVLKAIAVRGGRIRPVVVVVKAVASAIAIGTGSSVGREGPIVQVGSALGSTFGQWFKLGELRIKNLIACGAAAGIAAVFNAPIAGVIFASEVILRDFGARALSTVVVAAVSSSVISQIYLGKSPAFIPPNYKLESPYEIFLYFLLGILAAFAAHFFMHVLHKFEDWFDAWKFPNWLKPAVGGLLVGVLGLYFPQVFGSGLPAIENALHGNLGLSLLVALVFLKILATSISLGSGSSGGVFAPALFIGAVLGGAFGRLFEGGMPFAVAPSGAYALVGMASVFAAAAHAPVTAILIVFEMTSDYRIILPLMAAVVIATVISQRIHKDSIYTVRLRQAGINIGFLGEAKVLGGIQVSEVMSKEYREIPENAPARELIDEMSQLDGKSLFVVNAKGALTGFIKKQEVQQALLDAPLDGIVVKDLAQPILEYCVPEEPLSEAMRLMNQHGLTELPVVFSSDSVQLSGVLRSKDVFKVFAGTQSAISTVELGDGQASDSVQYQFRIPLRSSFVGKQIRELDIPEGVRFFSIRRGSKYIVPIGSTVLYPRDRIWMIVPKGSESVYAAWMKFNKIS